VYLGKKIFKKLLRKMNITTIISVLLRNIIPFCIQNSGNPEQNITNILLKVGDDLINSNFKEEWLEYGYNRRPE